MCQKKDWLIQIRDKNRPSFKKTLILKGFAYKVNELMLHRDYVRCHFCINTKNC